MEARKITHTTYPKLFVFNAEEFTQERFDTLSNHSDGFYCQDELIPQPDRNLRIVFFESEDKTIIKHLYDIMDGNLRDKLGIIFAGWGDITNIKPIYSLYVVLEGYETYLSQTPSNIEYEEYEDDDDYDPCDRNDCEYEDYDYEKEEAEHKARMAIIKSIERHYFKKSKNVKVNNIKKGN